MTIQINTIADYAKLAAKFDKCPPELRPLRDNGAGILTEVCEALDLVKKWLFHGKPMDLEALALEVGDTFWYVIHSNLSNSLENVAPLVGIDPSAYPPCTLKELWCRGGELMQGESDVFEVALLFNVFLVQHGYSIQSILVKNIEKLAARYPEVDLSCS